MVCGSVHEDLRQSIPRRAQELCGLSQNTTWRILHWNLNLHPFKIQLIQNLKVYDHRNRYVFAYCTLDVLEREARFWQKRNLQKKTTIDTNTNSVYGMASTLTRFTKWNSIRKSFCLVRFLDRRRY